MGVIVVPSLRKNACPCKRNELARQNSQTGLWCFVDKWCFRHRGYLFACSCFLQCKKKKQRQCREESLKNPILSNVCKKGWTVFFHFCAEITSYHLWIYSRHETGINLIKKTSVSSKMQNIYPPQVKVVDTIRTQSFSGIANTLTRFRRTSSPRSIKLFLQWAWFDKSSFSSSTQTWLHF